MSADDYFRFDRTSFKKPLDDAIAAYKRILNTPASSVKDSEKTLNAAMSDKKAIKAFNDDIARHIEDESFPTLPRVRIGIRRMQGLHVLKHEPFRGVFLVAPDNSAVIALVFSRRPHNFSKRLAELASAWRTDLEEANSDNAGQGEDGEDE